MFVLILPMNASLSDGQFEGGNVPSMPIVRRPTMEEIVGILENETIVTEDGEVKWFPESQLTPFVHPETLKAMGIGCITEVAASEEDFVQQALATVEANARAQWRNTIVTIPTQLDKMSDNMYKTELMRSASPEAAAAANEADDMQLRDGVKITATE